jgi:hypothetical protein
MTNLPPAIREWAEKASEAEKIYEPKYGGKDHSGYETLMKYEVNFERQEAFITGAAALFNHLLELGPESFDRALKAGFDHPCAITCSGWEEGRLRGRYEMSAQVAALKAKLEAHRAAHSFLSNVDKRSIGDIVLENDALKAKLDQSEKASSQHFLQAMENGQSANILRKERDSLLVALQHLRGAAKRALIHWKSSEDTLGSMHALEHALSTTSGWDNAKS